MVHLNLNLADLGCKNPIDQKPQKPAEHLVFIPI